MDKKLSVLFSVAILLTVSVVASVEFNQTADALKSKGTSNPKYGSDTKSKVCGDRLCSEVSSEQKNTQDEETKGKHGESSHGEQGKHGESSHGEQGKHGEDKGKHGEASHGDKEKMKQKHLQMLEKMKSMSKMEMIDSMKSMMSEHHTMKIQQMSQMDRPELLKHIEKMLDKMAEDSHEDTDDISHEESDEKHKTAKLLAEQHLQTFDELDFDVFTNQKWDRLHESHSQDIVVHWPDGRTTEGIEPHIEDLKAMFVWAPDARIEQHPIKIASGQWTSVIGIIEGTFTEPMPLPDGTTVEPTGKSFKLTMNTVGYWEDGVMTEEYLFWDNLEFMKQIGLS
jgi:hypothetical protein